LISCIRALRYLAIHTIEAFPHRRGVAIDGVVHQRAHYKAQLLNPPNLSARCKYRSPALVIGRHWQLGLCVGLSLGRDDGEFASAILDGRIPELVVLTLLVELDAGADTDVVGNVGRPDCID
jgi:hypothetical protein